MPDTSHAMNPLQNSIPMDVLCIIFDMLRSPDESSTKFDWPLQWVQVTHVCRSWREAALSVSFLWTHIHMDASVSWAVEFARRSGNAPIHIYLNGINGFGGIFGCMKCLLQENRHRIQGIFLEDIHEYDEDLLIYLLSATGDDGPLILDDLKISLHDKAYDDRDDIYNYTLLLPLNDILDASQLKRLSLEYCAIAEESGPFHNLSLLSIKETHEPNFAAPLLCRALLDMPNIETLDLTLEYGEFGPLNSPNFGSQRVTLPKLYHIGIHAWPIQWIVPLFQMIVSRPQRTVWVTGVEVDRFEQIFQVFTCILSHAIENPTGSMHRLTLLLAPGELCVRASHGNQILDDDIRYSVDWGASDMFQSGFNLTYFLLNGLLQRINHQDLRILDLSSSIPLPARVWVGFFGKLPSLTLIGIASPGEPQFFAALIDGSENTPVETNVSVVLPFQALMEVRVAVDRREGVFADTDMECMLKCLRTRMDLGLELKALSFMMGCSNRSDLVSQVNAFRGVVTKMEVSTELLKFYYPR